MRPGPVAHTMKLCGYASAGRVRLKAHPVPQPKPRDPSRGPQAADTSSTCRQQRAGGSEAKAAPLLPLTYLPFRGGEVDSDSARKSGPNGFGPVRCQHKDVLSANPGAISRSRAASSHDRPAKGASLGHVSVRAERWLARRQAHEAIDQTGDNQTREHGWQPGEALDQFGVSQSERNHRHDEASDNGRTLIRRVAPPSPGGRREESAGDYLRRFARAGQGGKSCAAMRKKIKACGVVESTSRRTAIQRPTRSRAR